MKYGLTDEIWNKCKIEIRADLVERAKRQSTISYSELVTEITTERLEADGQTLAHLLGEISTTKSQESRGMLSVVVVHKTGDQMPGEGFFSLAVDLGKNISDKEQCWINELHLVYSAWS